MPAYFAEKTVAKTVADIPREFVDDVILVDDCSKDNTFAVAQSLGITAYRNDPNQNYGGNVKRCLQYALDAGAERGRPLVLTRRSVAATDERGQAKYRADRDQQARSHGRYFGPAMARCPANDQVVPPGPPEGF